MNIHGFSNIIKIQNLPTIRGNGEIETLLKFHTMENMRWICDLVSYHLENYPYEMDTQLMNINILTHFCVMCFLSVTTDLKEMVDAKYVYAFTNISIRLFM